MYVYFIYFIQAITGLHAEVIGYLHSNQITEWNWMEYLFIYLQVVQN